MLDFLRVLISVSEKAANIARIIRFEDELLQLLVEEKESLKKNDRVIQDFKTLADVLIQETVRHEVSILFPEIAENIYGEESNLFTTPNGEQIRVIIEEHEDNTRKLLEKILPSHPEAARLLANEVHRTVSIEDDAEMKNFPHDLIQSFSSIGIWIDPIDATSEYIHGKVQEEIEEDERIVSEGGLRCVTVLIGAFDLSTGSSIFGVINQPFWRYDPKNKLWRGRYFWGVSYGSTRTCGSSDFDSLLKPRNFSSPIILLSDSENPALKEKMENDFKVVHAPGAGYKLLCVILGLADFYILTKCSTYFWDTCAPNALLKSLPTVGAIEILQQKLQSPEGSLCEISYTPDSNKKAMKYANVGGIFVYRDKTKAASLFPRLQSILGNTK